MNVTTIEMAKHEAMKHFREYRDAVRVSRRKEDVALMRGYRALSKGHKLIDVHDAMKSAGLNEKKQPKLAICRADAQHCWWFWHSNGSAEFAMDQHFGWRRVSRDRYVRFPAGTFPPGAVDRLNALVPSIPPRLRPDNLPYSSLHILWEAEWESVPTDPMLLRHLDGALYVVLAVWDLTNLEKAVLKRAL